MLAASQGWNWFSMGQLLRDANDVESKKIIQQGKLVPDNKVYEIVGNSIRTASGAKEIVFDGFPRKINQAEWLINNKSLPSCSIDLVIVLDVPKIELYKRLQQRDRFDDVPLAIEERLRIYEQDTYPILDYFINQGVKIIHVDGVGSVDEVHNRVIKELISCKLL